MIESSEWLRVLNGDPAARKVLVCFPHAGGSANYFRTWAKSSPAELNILAVQYPGRADRLMEDCYEDLGEMAKAVHQALPSFSGRDVVFFGHSLGAVLAYEVARLATSAEFQPSRLIASACRVPDESGNVVDSEVLWDDDAAMQSLVSLGGTNEDPELLADPRVRELVLPYLRADYQMLQRYKRMPGPALSCELLVVRGATDPDVSYQDGERWSELTTGEFRHRELPGGHFYLSPDPPIELYLAPFDS
ncbi:thioesterase II family protein [Psychromicrobium lacuslunae]|uniref:Thioesterase domain-containing protein n=1 Tax=Psychromicrobium lacuslunae TaxID=1618207 RepID=A0A0D4C2B1_9MICC|nr:alpha/beta fold hydrolase [Psychromicrobium lacuslunae]AJT42520.1 hypothetical protein UM93_15330 [Psychromicrobium lacuslunae]